MSWICCVFALVLALWNSGAIAETTVAESRWGRLYLRGGVAPIQYFRDSYGGPMVRRELQLLFAENRLGCEPLSAAEQAVITKANGSVALVVDRGVCSFAVKSQLAQEMGAAVLIIISEDESAKPPVATVRDGEINVASVMIRRSAGTLLREAAQRQTIFGQLIPITCRGKPYACEPQSTAEAKYVDQNHARSGVIIAQDSGQVVGDFLTASYGGIVPAASLSIEPFLQDGCSALPASSLTGKAVLVSRNEGECSDLVKVSIVQNGSAVLALIDVGEDPTEMQPPTLPAQWHGYNITLVVAAISSSTAAKLAALSASQVEVALEQRNAIADAWKQVRQLSTRTAWPTRKDRKHKTLTRLLTAFDMGHAQLQELKSNFLVSGGGSEEEWASVTRAALALDADTHQDGIETKEVAVEATGM